MGQAATQAGGMPFTSLSKQSVHLETTLLSGSTCMASNGHAMTQYLHPMQRASS